MLTEQQIQDQQNYERKQIQGGLHKLRANTTKLEEKTYASATVYGSACVSSILPDLIAFIDSKKEKYSRFNAAKDKHIFHKHIFPADTTVQALLTCKVVFDHVFSPQQKKHSVTTIAIAIGTCLLYTSPSPRDRYISRMPSSA